MYPFSSLSSGSLSGIPLSTTTSRIVPSQPHKGKFPAPSEIRLTALTPPTIQTYTEEEWMKRNREFDNLINRCMRDRENLEDQIKAKDTQLSRSRRLLEDCGDDITRLNSRIRELEDSLANAMAENRRFREAESKENFRQRILSSRIVI